MLPTENIPATKISMDEQKADTETYSEKKTTKTFEILKIDENPATFNKRRYEQLKL